MLCLSARDRGDRQSATPAPPSLLLFSQQTDERAQGGRICRRVRRNGIGSVMKFPRFLKSRSAERPQNVRRFLTAMEAFAPQAGLGAHGFRNPDGGCYGFVQFLVNSPQSVTIHRLWTLQPGQGNGTRVLNKVCELADFYSVELKLKTLPFGRKPYRMSPEQLLAWYERHGFKGTRRKMIRTPQGSQLILLSQSSPDSGL
jgi:hypothetical protein